MLVKITKQAKFQFITIVILSTSFTNIDAQQTTKLNVVSKLKIYKEQVAVDSLKKMVELKTISPKLVYDLRYATVNNFLHQRLYKSINETYLRLPVAKALAAAEQELNERGFGLKIWDAYRQYSV